MRRRLVPLAICLFALPLAARAQPGPPPGRWQAQHVARAREMREKMLRKVHTMAVIELGNLLNLSTEETIRLSERLRPFDDQRMQLQLQNFDAMQGLKRAAEGQGGDATALARQIADNRVKLAQLDRQELDVLLKGLPPDKAAKVALFLARFPHQVAFIAREAQMHRMMMRGRGPMMQQGGPMGEPPAP